MDPLKDLEEKVGAACRELEALRKQNRGLKSKVKKLESELAESADDESWKEERNEVQKRVAKLAASLESLL